MKRSRLTEEQIVRIIKEATAGKKIVDICRHYSHMPWEICGSIA